MVEARLMFAQPGAPRVHQPGNHPTHWLEFDFYKGSTSPVGDGLAFHAYPKALVTRAEMQQQLRLKAKETGASGALNFSQILMLEKPEGINQTAAKVTV